MDIFRATPGHLALARIAVEKLHDRPVDDVALTAFLADDACYQFVAVEGERVVGGLNGYKLRNPGTLLPQFLLYELDVEEDVRRRGIARALIAAFDAAARAAGACEIWVGTGLSNDAARALYLACGYEVEMDGAIIYLRTFEPGVAGPRSA